MKLKPGTKVRIKIYERRPHFWNSSGQMDKYMGKKLTISECLSNPAYKMKECPHWTWLREHFDVIEGDTGIMEPNFAFHLKKIRGK